MIYAEEEGREGKVGSENTSNFSSKYTNVCTEWQLCGRCRNKYDTFSSFKDLTVFSTEGPVCLSRETWRR